MKKRYSRKFVCEAITYWRTQLKRLNEAEGLYSVNLTLFTADPGGGSEESIELQNEEQVTSEGYRWIKGQLEAWRDASRDSDEEAYEEQYREQFDNAVESLSYKLQELLSEYKKNGEASVSFGDVDGVETWMELNKA